MPNIKSAIKRVSVTKRQQQENRGSKTELLNAVKKFRSLVEAKEINKASDYYPAVVSIIDKACDKGLIKKNTANRKKANLAKLLAKSK